MLGAATAFVVVYVVSVTSLRYFHNGYSLLDRHPVAPGELVAVGCVLTGPLVFAFTWWLARRSAWVVLLVMALVFAAAWVLVPTEVDASESFVERPNDRWACTGWTFSYYPPGQQDGSSTVYCVGLEKRIADG
jgi:uncharacterized membrane protein